MKTTKQHRSEPRDRVSAVVRTGGAMSPQARLAASPLQRWFTGGALDFMNHNFEALRDEKLPEAVNTRRA